MESVEYLIIGAGISGLSFANAIRAETAAAGRALPSVRVLEADAEPGGYCKTIVKDGFVWDYSGHFFHFKHPEIESWLRERMPGQRIHTVAKRSLIRFQGEDIDFPFQKNIHQLPRAAFIDCLVDLYFRTDGTPDSFKDMLYRRFGKSIAEYFLIPYNEKLYACDLGTLDVDAMGRFFPHADIADIIRNMREADNASYNATFTYPEGGAIQYVHALLADLPSEVVHYDTALESIDLERKIAQTSRGEVRYETLVSSAPLPRLLAMTGVAHDATVFSWNKVLVFNLGFDRKGRDDVHWMYFPDRALSFYRVGWYDNILGGDRMSLYVEIGAPTGQALDIESLRQAVLRDLAKEGITEGHQLVSWHTVTLDPAYVHITGASIKAHHEASALLASRGVHSVGRYGGWTYCSIEDNIVETRALATQLAGGRTGQPRPA